MQENFLKRFLGSAHYSRTLTILILLILLAAIPLTVYIAQKQQEIRQRADAPPPTREQILIKSDVGDKVLEVSGDEFYAYPEGRQIPEPPAPAGWKNQNFSENWTSAIDVFTSRNSGGANRWWCQNSACQNCCHPLGNDTTTIVGPSAFVNRETLLFRKSFTLSPPSGYRTKQVTLDIWSDNNNWVYLDGQFITQNGMALSTVDLTPHISSGNNHLLAIQVSNDDQDDNNPIGLTYQVKAVYESLPVSITPTPAATVTPGTTITQAPTNTPAPTSTGSPAVCRITWTLQPEQPFAPNTDFTAYIKGESSQRGWGYIKLRSEDGTAAISVIEKLGGSLGPLTNCTADQPCFKSNILHSLTAGTHTLRFYINNPQPDNPTPNSTPIECAEPKTFQTTAGGGTPTPTIPANTTRLALTLALPERSCVPNTPGSGGPTRCIDEGKSDPSRPTRTVSVELFDQNEQKIKEGNGNIAFDQTTGLIRTFKGNIDVTNLVSGTYIVKVKTDKFLKKRIAGIVNIVPNTTNQLPPTSLLIGDLNGDNKRNIDDYNTLLNCYGSKANTASCGNFKNSADLNDDGKVDNADYGLFIANFSIIGGD